MKERQRWFNIRVSPLRGKLKTECANNICKHLIYKKSPELEKWTNLERLKEHSMF